MSSKGSQHPTLDPYEVLGLLSSSSSSSVDNNNNNNNNASISSITDADIRRAYKKLALKYHPDKQSNDLTEKEKEVIAKKFQNIQDARNFLLEPEFQQARREYDLKRQSELLRKQTEKLREQTMNVNRKRMRDELLQKEQQALAETKNAAKKSNKNNQHGKSNSSSSSSKTTTKSYNDDLVNQLRKDGQKLREKYDEQNIQKELERQYKVERKVYKDNLEERQIRLKWDRKKIGTSPSEDSIASLFSTKFGPVEHVEMIGSKGNQALVTFVNASSCRPCVEEYATSKQMRAKYVGKRKEREEKAAEEEDDDDDNDEVLSAKEKQSRMSASASASASASSSVRQESLQDRQLRQAAEREALLRQMEEEEEEKEVDRGGGGEDTKRGNNKTSSKSNESSKKFSSNINFAPFPLPFPDIPELQNLTPLEQLESFEASILEKWISPEDLKSIQITR